MTIVHYGTHSDPHELIVELLEHHPNMVGVDTETKSVSDITILGVGFSAVPEDGFYITADDELFPEVMQLLQNDKVRKIYHNAPFDLRVLRPHDIDVSNVDDTALMARLYPEPSAVLEDISYWVGYQTKSMKNVFSENNTSTVEGLPFTVLAKKCCQDAMATRALYDYYAHGRIDMDYYEWLRPMIGILNIISRQGMKLDQDRLRELNSHYRIQVMMYRQLCQAQGFNPGSPAQVGYHLASRGNFLPLTRKGTQLVTDDEHLIKLQDPMAHIVLQYRHASKMESTYIRPFIGQDRAYTTLRMEAGTGRVNSTAAGKDQSDRNLQNIPKQAEKGDVSSIRGAFVPDNGIYTKIDKSQAELRILAELSQDKAMIELFSRDEDIHGYVVERTGLSRTLAKNLNFGIMYGGDVQTIANFLHMSNLGTVQELLDRYIGMFPDAWSWLLTQEDIGIKDGLVHTRKGRPMRLPAEQGEKHMRNCARNYPIQGTAAEDMFELMMDPSITQYLSITRLQIHDELIMDGAIVVEDMVLSDAKTRKEGHPTYEVKGRLAWLSGFYLPMEVQYVDRWG